MRIFILSLMLLSLNIMVRCLPITPISCIKRGRLTYGGVISSDGDPKKAGTVCKDSPLALDYGTYVKDGSGEDKQLTDHGLCLNNVVVEWGILEILEGDIIYKNGKTIDGLGTKCSQTSTDVIVLSASVIIRTLPSKTGVYKLLTVQNNPLLAYHESTTLESSVCLKKGTVVDGEIDVKTNLVFPSAYKSCPANSVLVEEGVGIPFSGIAVPLPIGLCMAKSKILSGRVITQKDAIVPIDATTFTQANCLEDGVVAEAGTLLFITKQAPPPTGYNKDPEPYSNDYRKPSYEHEYERNYDEYPLPRQEKRRPFKYYDDSEEPRNYRDESNEYRRKGKSNIRKELDFLSDLIEDRVQSKLKQKTRSRDY